MREYIDEKHHLTSWGKVLQAALSKVGPSKEQEEAAFLAVELMRFGLLNADTMFEGYSGAPIRGSRTPLPANNLVFIVTDLP